MRQRITDELDTSKANEKDQGREVKSKQDWGKKKKLRSRRKQKSKHRNVHKWKRRAVCECVRRLRGGN